MPGSRPGIVSYIGWAGALGWLVLYPDLVIGGPVLVLNETVVGDSLARCDTPVTSQIATQLGTEGGLIVVLDVISLFGFLMAHGVSAGVVLSALRHERQIDRLRWLLQSVDGRRAMLISLLVYRLPVSPDSWANGGATAAIPAVIDLAGRSLRSGWGRRVHAC